MKLLAPLIQLLMKLPDGLKLKLAGSPNPSIRGNTLNTDNHFLASNNAKGPQLNKMTPDKARSVFRRMSLMVQGSFPRSVNKEDIQIPLEDTKLNARLYCPKSLSDHSALVLYYHGGGNVIGDLDSYDVLCGDIAEQLNLRVISVDYRLAPEFKFPVPGQDAYSAYCWARDNADQLQIHSDQIILAGDSAGGYLSSVICLQALMNKVQLPKAQVLIYPMCDLSEQRESYQLFANNLVLTKNLMDYFVGHFINSEADRVNPLASPLIADDSLLKQMPSTIITLAGFDPLYDEGLAYYQKLNSLGVNVQVIEHKDLTHGFITMTGVLKRGKEAQLEIIQAAKNLIT